MSTFKNKFEELNMTQDEINRFTEAMKKEEFRKLLIEYAEEISDPKNRELYEQEISKLEEERGMDVTFIHPEPGYCIKTTQGGSKKCFINICKNSNIEKPSSKRDVNNNKGGLYWSIPHSCSPAREDIDKSKETCIVYDVVFHPDAYRMGETNQRFNKLLQDSAMDTIEKNFNVKLDQVNAKVLKNLNFKGKPTASVIRKQKTDVKPDTSSDPIEKLVDQLKTDYLQTQITKQSVKTEIKSEIKVVDDKYTKPVYKIVYRGQADMQDHAHQLDTSIIHSTRPKEIYVSIELPLCKSSSNVILDIFEKRVYLESESPAYKLDLSLSYPVNEKEAKAKFDKSKRCLNVTLPVIPFVSKIETQVVPVEQEQQPQESEQVCPKEETITPLVEQIKYSTPHVELKQLNDSIVIRTSVTNYDKNSIRVEYLNNCMIVSCESLSSGSYITYYKVYLSFFTVDLTGVNDKIVHVNDDVFEIVMFKELNEIKVIAGSQSYEHLPEGIETLQVTKLDCNFELQKEDEIKNMSKKDYIVNFDMISKQDDSDDEDDKEEIKDMLQSSSSNDFSNESLSSSLNSNGFAKIKGILKKPRSISEGESSLRSSMDSNSCEGSQELCSSKKCVSFNKQVVRNVFKPGSTIVGMKKPNSNKNKKKNQKRNRTVSDPSHNGEDMPSDLMEQQMKFRARSLSESSDDVLMATSNESLDQKNSNKKKKKKTKETQNEMFNMEKMITMKSQGVLPSDDSHKTTCAFQFKNKIANDLD